MKKNSLLFRLIKGAVKFFYPQIEVVGAENLPDEPCVIVGNHSQMDGPVSCELYFPGTHYIWCAGEMMHTKEVPTYAYWDFWSAKPAATRWFFKLLSYIIAPLSAFVFNSANTIGVYHDTRILKTFRESMEKLQEGANLIIFPEHYEPYSCVVNDFQDRFIDLARMYYKKTGKELKFVPMYIAPKLRQIHIGTPVQFSAAAKMDDERSRIKNYLMAEITSIAKALPEHKVVPYENIPKRLRGSNLSTKPYRPGPKPPVVDYRQLRPRMIFNGDPRFSHLKLLGGWIVYFILYFVSEGLIPQSACHVIHSPLDDMIPFNEYWLIFYCSWYACIIASLLYFLLYDIDSFKKLQTYLIITQLLAMVIYFVYPSVQLMRPTSFEHHNFFTWLMAFIYNFDTPTGVCPSLHVAYSIGMATVWCKKKELTNGWRVLCWVAVVLISLSTCFVKQHSIIDVFVAIPVCMIANFLLYGKVGDKRPKLQEHLERL